LTKITAKQLKGVNLKPRMYFATVSKYVEAINTGGIPNISTAWEYMVETECREALEKSTTFYESMLKQCFLNEKDAKSLEEIYRVLKENRDLTLEKYNKFTTLIEGNATVAEFKDKLKDHIDDREQAALMINEEMAQGNNEEILKILSRAIKDNLAAGIYDDNNLDLYSEDFNAMATSYEENAKGMGKCTTFISFLNTYNKQSLQSIASTLKKNFQLKQNRFTNEGSKAQQIEEELRSRVDLLEGKESIYNEQILRLKNEKIISEEKNKELKRQVDKRKAEDNLIVEEYETEIQAKDREFQKEKTEYEVKMSELKKKINNKKTACSTCAIF